jgi:hypothetical protein
MWYLLYFDGEDHSWTHKQESVVDSSAIAQCANVSTANPLDIQNLTDEGYDLLECDPVV